MIYESVLTQLNNYGKLNNDGIGIDLKGVPVVAEKYLNIDAGDNIKLKSVEIEKINDSGIFDVLNYKDEFTQCNLNPASFETVKNNYWIIVNDAVNVGDVSKSKSWRFYYIKNGEEKFIIIRWDELLKKIGIANYLVLNDYQNTIVNNLNKITIDVTDEHNVKVIYNDNESYHPAGEKGLVPTPISIFFASGGMIGAHTEFILKYTNANNEEIKSEPFNIVLVYNNNQQT